MSENSGPGAGAVDIRGGDEVVVGVDSSAGSRAALRWAAEEARVRAAPLRAVAAWHVGPAPASPNQTAMDAHTAEDVGRASQRQLEDTVRSVLGDQAGDVRCSAVEGRAARVLIDASAGARLVVVGTRGHGGFVGLLLGSVSQQLTQHARCPVTVVPLLVDDPAS